MCRAPIEAARRTRGFLILSPPGKMNASGRLVRGIPGTNPAGKRHVWSKKSRILPGVHFCGVDVGMLHRICIGRCGRATRRTAQPLETTMP
jgi:hypothetical protein